MMEFVWSVNSNLKSVTFKSCFAPFWLVPASATKSFVVDLLFFVSKISRRRRPTGTISSLSLWTATFGRNLST